MCSSTKAFTRLANSVARSDGGGRVGIDDPARPGEHSEVMVGVAEQRVDHGDALEIMADLVLHGHADSAVELDRALSDDAARTADLYLDGGNRFAPLGGVRFLGHHGAQHRHAARLFECDQHLAGAMLQHLEIADRYAELLALLQVVDCELVHGAHRADRFGGERRDRDIGHLLDQRERVAGLADHGVGADLDIGERHFRGPQSVHRGIAAPRDAGRRRVDEKQSDAVFAALIPG
jgi:hypothetical protein